MYTIDASTWVNACDDREPGHEISRELFELLTDRMLPIVVPSLVLAEVAGAISRTRHDPDGAQAFAEALGNLPNVTVLALDTALANRALVLAAQRGLRGADGVYAAVAEHAGCRLVTLDGEQLTRLVGVVEVATPAAVLGELATPPEAAL